MKLSRNYILESCTITLGYDDGIREIALKEFGGNSHLSGMGRVSSPELE